MTMYSIWGRMGEDHDYYCLKSNVEQTDVDKIIKHYLKTWREVEFREFAILHSQEGEKEIDMSTLTKAVQTHKEYEEAVKDEVNPTSLTFENLTPLFWSYDGNEILTHHTPEAVKNWEGCCNSYEVRYVVEEDDTYIMFRIDNGCGDQWDIVLSKHLQLGG